ncbi:hypothetical protein ACWGJ9_08425 [Curtobacterium citreum]
MTSDLRPDIDLIDAIDDLPFGYIWNGVAEFSPSLDRHAFIIGRPYSGKTHIAASIAVAAASAGATVINATGRSLLLPEDRVAVSTRLEQIVQSIADGSRIAGDPLIIVIADESILRGRNAKANLHRLTTIIDDGPAVGIHLVLVARDVHLTCADDLDELDTFKMPAGTLTVLLGRETDAKRYDTFGQQVPTLDPGLPNSGLISSRGDAPQQFRAWTMTHEDAQRILAS